MFRRFLAAALLLLAAGILALATIVLRRPPRTVSPPVPPGGLSRVELPEPLYTEVEALRAYRKPGADRFQGETAGEAVEKRLDLLLPFLRSPPVDAADLENRFPAIGQVLAEAVLAGRLAPPLERPLHSGPGVEAFQGEVPASAGPGAAPPGAAGEPPRPRAPLALAAELLSLIRPLTLLESAALKVVRVEGPPEGPLTAEVIYQLVGQGGGGERRQWNGRWRLGFGAGLSLAMIEPLEANRVVLARRPFEDASAAALGRNPSYAAQLRPGIDFFRDRLDAATGIDVYGHHGISVGDVDGDGLEDIYLPEPPGLPNLLFRNRGDGTFEDVSRGSGADLLDASSQALLVDLDNDGDLDIFLVGEEGVKVLLNDGRGRFTPHPTGVEHLEAASATTICAAAADYDLDGVVDVYVGSYVFWRGSSSLLGSRLPSPYHDAHNGAPNFLLKGRGDGTFRDVTREAGLAEGNDRFTFAVAFGDYDGDGFPDLAVANDFGRKNLYRNQGNGTFVETTEASGATDLGAGMSVTFGDYDNDGRLDLYFGNMFSTAGLRVTTWSGFKPGNPLRADYQKHARGNTLLRNKGDGTFEDVSLRARAYLGRWAWASDFLDLDQDGREDLYIANGFVTSSDSRDL